MSCVILLSSAQNNAEMWVPIWACNELSLGSRSWGPYCIVVQSEDNVSVNYAWRTRRQHICPAMFSSCWTIFVCLIVKSYWWGSLYKRDLWLFFSWVSNVIFLWALHYKPYPWNSAGHIRKKESRCVMGQGSLTYSYSTRRCQGKSGFLNSKSGVKLKVNRMLFSWVSVNLFGVGVCHMKGECSAAQTGSVCVCVFVFFKKLWPVH